MRRPPVMAVTGAIASGKSLAAGVLASAGGRIIDCDSLAHRALDNGECRDEIVRAFGPAVLTGDGGISRENLAKIVFSCGEDLAALDRMIKPYVRRLIGEEVMRVRASSLYIVLDAVLFFEYKFRFKTDLTIRTYAPERIRLERMMKRDGFTLKEARMRLERQKYLEHGWSKADLEVRTDRSIESVKRRIERIRDDFLIAHDLFRRK